MSANPLRYAQWYAHSLHVSGNYRCSPPQLADFPSLTGFEPTGRERVPPGAPEYRAFRRRRQSCAAQCSLCDLCRELFALNRLKVPAALLAIPFASQRFLNPFPLPGLQVESVPLNIFDDVLLQDLSFKALECAFQAFAFVNVNFSQRDPPYSNQIRVLSVAASGPVSPPGVHWLRSGRGHRQDRICHRSARSW